MIFDQILVDHTIPRPPSPFQYMDKAHHTTTEEKYTRFIWDILFFYPGLGKLFKIRHVSPHFRAIINQRYGKKISRAQKLVEMLALRGFDASWPLTE